MNAMGFEVVPCEETEEEPMEAEESLETSQMQSSRG